MGEKRCVSCHAAAVLLTESEREAALNLLSNWIYNESKKRIECVFKFKGFYKTMAFVNAVAWIAHDQGHHPDMMVSYNEALIAFQTHEAGGVTQNDIICAELVSAL